MQHKPVTSSSAEVAEHVCVQEAATEESFTPTLAAAACAAAAVPPAVPGVAVDVGALTASDTVSPDRPVSPEAAGRALAWGCAAGRGPGAAAAGSWGSSTARCACITERACARQGRRMAARPGQSVAESRDKAALSREGASATGGEKK